MISASHRVPDCPIFYPTLQQWGADPFAYIRNVIAPAAQATAGIAKVVPPPGWRPPFSLPNRDSFTFTPRVQVLNALEATVRAQAQFLVDLRMFNFARGHPLSPPFPVSILSLYWLLPYVLVRALPPEHVVHCANQLASHFRCVVTVVPRRRSTDTV